jgi:hypothetical protein
MRRKKAAHANKYKEKREMVNIEFIRKRSKRNLWPKVRRRGRSREELAEGLAKVSKVEWGEKPQLWESNLFLEHGQKWPRKKENGSKQRVKGIMLKSKYA